MINHCEPRHTLELLVLLGGKTKYAGEVYSSTANVPRGLLPEPVIDHVEDDLHISNKAIVNRSQSLGGC